MDRFDFLSAIHPITRQEYDELTSNLNSKSFKKGDDIVDAGQIQKHIYFIKTGVQMLNLDRNGKIHIIAFTYHPNLCAIPESFSEQKPSNYKFTCVTDSEVDHLSFADMQKLFVKYQNIETLFRKIHKYRTKYIASMIRKRFSR